MSHLLERMGKDLLLSQEELSRLIRSAPRRYKVFEIPKRTPGKMRTIAQPAREVKGLQYWVMENFLHQFKVHPAATGYREGLNIADNARPHVHGRFLLKLDFKDFFPSLTAADFLFFLHGISMDSRPATSMLFSEYSSGSQSQRSSSACRSGHHRRLCFRTCFCSNSIAKSLDSVRPMTLSIPDTQTT